MRKPRSDYPSEQADKFLVRFPDGMRERIAEAATANNRSMNAEIVSRLEATFAFSGNLAGPDINERVGMMIRATSAGTALDAMAAVQLARKEAGDDLTADKLFELITNKLGEFIELKVTDLRATQRFNSNTPKGEK